MHDFSRRHSLLTYKARNYHLAGAILILMGALLSACGPAAPEQTTENPTPTVAMAVAESVAEESYPPPAPLPTVADAYPVATSPPDAYPPAAGSEDLQEPRFQFDVPVRVGSTTVSGQAPPGLVLAIMDVTFNGALLGIGPSDEQGRFEISVNDLVEGNRIGVTFAELEPGLTFADMSIKYFPHRGEGFMNLPNVGVLFDTTLVEP